MNRVMIFLAAALAGATLAACGGGEQPAPAAEEGAATEAEDRQSVE